jgi:hypothetical protein
VPIKYGWVRKRRKKTQNKDNLVNKSAQGKWKFFFTKASRHHSSSFSLLLLKLFASSEGLSSPFCGGGNAVD